MKSIQIYIILALCLFFSAAAYSQINVEDSLQVILTKKDTTRAELRFINAHNLMFYYSSPEEAEMLGKNVVYPFVQKTWKNKSEQLAHLARLHLLVSLCYRERGGDDRDEKERLFAEKALETALKSEDNATCARCYYVCGNMEFKRGDAGRAYEYLDQAITYYDKMEQYTKSSEVLIYMIGNFFDIKDMDGIGRVLRRMEEYLEKDTLKQSQYQYNIAEMAYLELKLEKEETVDYRLVDSLILSIRKNIDLVENYLEQLSPFHMHGYPYYYVARALDIYYPEQTDSIFFYLDKAQELFDTESFVRKQEANAVTEFHIHNNIIRANVLARTGKTQEAYKVASKSLPMLEELKNYKNIDQLRYYVYRFMVDYYEKINRPAEALKYEKLLRESEAQRYKTERIQAVNDITIKYEAEKKEIRIQTLIRENEIAIKENEAARRTLLLTIGLLLALLTTAGFIILSSRLKRKNVEQQFYETALQAELNQNELEKIQNLKKQLAQNPVKNIIENITQQVSASLIDRDNKKAYLERLAKIDTQMLETAYQNSTVKITGMDMKYIICFVADIDVKDISLLFNIEPASVHTVRYRIKKKFQKEDSFKMILE